MMHAPRVTLHSARDRLATALQLRAGSWQYSGRSMGYSASYVCQLSDRSQTAYPDKRWYRGDRILLAELRLYTKLIRRGYRKAPPSPSGTATGGYTGPPAGY